MNVDVDQHLPGRIRSAAKASHETDKPDGRGPRACGVRNAKNHTTGGFDIEAEFLKTLASCHLFGTAQGKVRATIRLGSFAATYWP